MTDGVVWCVMCVVPVCGGGGGGDRWWLVVVAVM